MRRCLSACAVLVLCGLAIVCGHEASFAATAPKGVRVEVFAQAPGARSLALCAGRVYVGTKGDCVYSIPLSGGAAVRAAAGLSAPNGVACLAGRLFVAARDRVVAFTPGPGRLGTGEVIRSGLPNKSHHGLRYIKAGPDGRLYVALGSPCNICQPQGLEGSIVRMEPDGGAFERVAWGVRNSVGFDWRGGAMYFTDNGADGMGDDTPPDELNRLSPGAFYGFPFFGGRTRLRGFETAAPPTEQQAPVHEFQAHVAALGIHFYRGGMFPDLRGRALVAEHGSWNRTVPVGRQVVVVGIEGGRDSPFVSGIGRPVDVAELPDGSILVSDDAGGKIWRVSR